MNYLLPLTLAQGGPPLPGAGDLAPAPTTTTPGSPAGTPPAATQQRPFDPMLMIILLVVAMLVFTMWSSRRDRKRKEAMISAIKKHDRVQTIGGVIGSVVEVKPDYIVLKVDESSNTRITFARAAVQQVLSASPDSPAKVE